MSLKTNEGIPSFKKPSWQSQLDFPSLWIIFLFHQNIYQIQLWLSISLTGSWPPLAFTSIYLLSNTAWLYNSNSIYVWFKKSADKSFLIFLAKGNFLECFWNKLHWKKISVPNALKLTLRRAVKMNGGVLKSYIMMYEKCLVYPIWMTDRVTDMEIAGGQPWQGHTISLKHSPGHGMAPRRLSHDRTDSSKEAE